LLRAAPLELGHGFGDAQPRKQLDEGKRERR
jgi:hypothetical protein